MIHVMVKCTGCLFLSRLYFICFIVSTSIPYLFKLNEHHGARVPQSHCLVKMANVTELVYKNKLAEVYGAKFFSAKVCKTYSKENVLLV